MLWGNNFEQELHTNFITHIFYSPNTTFVATSGRSTLPMWSTYGTAAAGRRHASVATWPVAAWTTGRPDRRPVGPDVGWRRATNVVAHDGDGSDSDLRQSVWNGQNKGSFVVRFIICI